MLSLLGLPYETVEIDVRKGEQQTPAFLAKNPFGQVPVIEDDDVTLADSNAILVYLAQRYDDSGRWYPRNLLCQAHVQRWLSAAAGPLAYGPSAARVIRLFRKPVDLTLSQGIAARLFNVLESQLSARDFLVNNIATIADIALYSYTAVAPEGNISLAPYPHIRSWLQRIEALPGFLPMARTHID